MMGQVGKPRGKYQMQKFRVRGVSKHQLPVDVQDALLDLMKVCDVTDKSFYKAKSVAEHLSEEMGILPAILFVTEQLRPAQVIDLVAYRQRSFHDVRVTVGG